MTDAQNTAEAPVLVSRDGRVLTITLNRPEAGNAIDFPLANALAEAVAQVDDTVGAVLVLGAGRHFSVGGDIGGFAQAGDPQKFLTDLATDLHVGVSALAKLDVPVVIGAQGGVGGAGMSLLGVGDVVVAGESAKLRPAYLAIGLTPDGGMSWTLPRTLGHARFMDLLMTGDLLTAAQALDAGVVSRVVGDDEVTETATTLARRLADGPTDSYARLKTLVRQGRERSLDEQLAAEAEQIGISAASASGQEGVAAFLGKRAPNFPH